MAFHATLHGPVQNALTLSRFSVMNVAVAVAFRYGETVRLFLQLTVY